MPEISSSINATFGDSKVNSKYIEPAPHCPNGKAFCDNVPNTADGKGKQKSTLAVVTAVLAVAEAFPNLKPQRPALYAGTVLVAPSPATK